MIAEKVVHWRTIVKAIDKQVNQRMHAKPFNNFIVSLQSGIVPNSHDHFVTSVPIVDLVVIAPPQIRSYKMCFYHCASIVPFELEVVYCSLDMENGHFISTVEQLDPICICCTCFGSVL
ncbi:hypothetical protein TNCV_2656271 [Trichonephila clavipes]|nr:hypothetical protein TNCV_2656271 [Trichonephila clavipes]